jgi:hypothetical protein
MLASSRVLTTAADMARMARFAMQQPCAAENVIIVPFLVFDRGIEVYSP